MEYKGDGIDPARPTIFYTINMQTGYCNWFTDIRSNDLESNDPGSNNPGSNSIGTNDKRSKT